MVGGAIMRQLLGRGVPTGQIITRTHAELDLTEQAQVRAFFQSERIDEVYLAAAKVGGIHANNSQPAEFIHENLAIQTNAIHSAWKHGTKKLLFLGSSCIYPREAAQPMAEDSLLTGKLEPTNEPYAVAKIAGIKLCESYNRQYGASHGIDYRSVMPTNLYGPGDNYHPENSHVLPALIRRFHEAREAAAPRVLIWGTGTPKREFLYVDDMAAASIHVMNLAPEIYNAHTQPMQSHIEYDTSKPDGTPRKLMDVQRLQNLGWRATTSLADGIHLAYQDFLQNHRNAAPAS